VYAACECKSGYKYVCEEFGPTSPNDYCLNGIKYYTSCKTCGEYGYLTSCPTGVECSFEQCSGKYFPTGKCASGYTDISDTSCDWYKYWMPCTVAPGRTWGLVAPVAGIATLAAVPWQRKADIFFQFKLNWAGATDISDMSNWSAYQNGIIIGHAHDKRNVGVLSILTIKQ